MTAAVEPLGVEGATAEPDDESATDALIVDELDRSLGLPSLPRPPTALYVHVPFCVSLCPYCDFVVYAGAAARGPRARIGTFLIALERELDLRADRLDARWGLPGDPGRPLLTSVYLGGGTPSLLPASDVARLLDRVRLRFGIAVGAEVTIEANPGPDERGEPAAWRAAGITRLSVGAQSLDRAELRRLGRRHRSEDVADAVVEARAAGMGSVSLDLLYDIPGQTATSWAQTLEGVVALEPDHISTYALSLDDPDAEGLTGPTGDHLSSTAGARRWRGRARAAQDDDRAAAAYERATRCLRAAGFRGYEISNWARPGHASRHNLAYWRRAAFEALGPGAHAFDGQRRRWTAARLEGYLRALVPTSGDGPRLPPGGAEVIDVRTADVERVILGLRLDTGIPVSWADWRPLRDVVPWAVANGLLERGGDRLRLTTRGRLLSNEVFVRLA